MTDPGPPRGAPPPGGGGEDRPRKRPPRALKVYTLVVEVGRKAGDGLPAGATGAALMVYSSGVTEDEAVREAVAILRQADMAPLDVTGYGTPEDRDSHGPPVDPAERDLMRRTLAENAVVVAQVTAHFD